MTPEVAKAAMQFMLRTQLSGSEVPAFDAVMRELHEVPPEDVVLLGWNVLAETIAAGKIEAADVVRLKEAFPGFAKWRGK